MIRCITTAVLLGMLTIGTTAGAADWITAPSTFTHSPATGQRVAQYQPIPPVLVAQPADFLQSGYRHNRSSIRVGRDVDHLHIIEEWGRQVRPYGEWRFPYRPGSVPYSQWGPPFAGMYNFHYGRPYPHFGFGHGGFGGHGYGGPIATPYGGLPGYGGPGHGGGHGGHAHAGPGHGGGGHGHHGGP